MKHILSTKMIKGENEDEYQFHTENEIISFFTCGDCCSEGWIEHIENEEYLQDSTILEAEEIDSMSYYIDEEEEGFSNRQEQDKVYFFKIKTTKGYVTFDYRNSSNGYYGTYLSWFKKQK